MTHAYEQDPQSGASNCTCGAPERHVRHPHAFTEAHIWAQIADKVICTCGRDDSDPIHKSPDLSSEGGNRD